MRQLLCGHGLKENPGANGLREVPTVEHGQVKKKYVLTDNNLYYLNSLFNEISLCSF